MLLSKYFFIIILAFLKYVEVLYSFENSIIGLNMANRIKYCFKRIKLHYNIRTNNYNEIKKFLSKICASALKFFWWLVIKYCRTFFLRKLNTNFIQKFHCLWFCFIILVFLYSSQEFNILKVRACMFLE